MKLGRTEARQDGGENTPATSTVKRKGDEARGRDMGHAHIKTSGISNDVGCGEKKLKAGRHPLRNQAEGTHPILSSANYVDGARLSRNRAQVAPPASRRVWLAARTQDFIFTNSLLKAHFSADPAPRFHVTHTFNLRGHPNPALFLPLGETHLVRPFAHTRSAITIYARKSFHAGRGQPPGATLLGDRSTAYGIQKTPRPKSSSFTAQ
ncbi:hypothetical protein RHS01_04639 [Rhizoctonia solani]|uniref:Uncharacterized protein n=1 Tax=Rhizoctonia solani TaxID=456999 RepID=A0A8H7IFF9_9AGAM|nr:hypothetical protein RHS01_04639 [Rhizoctonia solani]